MLGTAEIDSDCSNASGGEFVRLLGDPGNGVAFDNVEVPQNGTYQLDIYYFYASDRFLEVIVNGTSLGVQTLPESHWCYQGAAESYSLDVDLDEGLNTVELKVANGEIGPFIDKIAFVDNQNNYLSLSAEKTVLTAGGQTRIILEAASSVNEPASVDLSVSGLKASQYQLDDATLSLSQGEDRTSTLFSIPENAIEGPQKAVIRMSDAQGNVLIGYPDSAAIDVYPGNTTYYISSSTGDDASEGTSPATPWKTMEKVSQSEFLPGDSILFKTGDTFVGQLVVPSSGHEGASIVIASYGEDSKPVLNGAGAEGGDYMTPLLIHNQDYIEVYDLELTNDRQVARSGVSDYEAYGLYVLNDGNEVMQHFVFRHLTVRDVFSLASEDEFNSISVAGIGFQTKRNREPGMAKHIRDVLVDSCYITRTTRFGIRSGHGGGEPGIGNDSLNRNMNLVFRDNHTYKTGGSGITPGRSYNCLLEGNIFEYPGSGEDPRMSNRGSGAWFWNCRNVVAQYNKSLHVRGHGDSYSMHIDHGNKHVIFQYNYSQDTEGGFVEILGNNVNSVYRFNVSVNDGFRENQWAKGSSIWISRFAGPDTRIASDSNYVYNNTIYIDEPIHPDISVNAKNTFIYNNIFYVARDDAEIGEQVELNMYDNGELKISSNSYFGNVNARFINRDGNPYTEDPQLTEPGATSVEGYKLYENSPALDAGYQFPEPSFPMAGKGIFKHIPAHPESDLYGNPVDLANEKPNIGAYNGEGVENTETSADDFEVIDPWECAIQPNPVRSDLKFRLQTKKAGKIRVRITDLQGRSVSSSERYLSKGNNTLKIPLKASLTNGVYVLVIREGDLFVNKTFLLLR